MQIVLLCDGSDWEILGREMCDSGRSIVWYLRVQVLESELK